MIGQDFVIHFDELNEMLYSPANKDSVIKLEDKIFLNYPKPSPRWYLSSSKNRKSRTERRNKGVYKRIYRTDINILKKSHGNLLCRLV